MIANQVGCFAIGFCAAANGYTPAANVFPEGTEEWSLWHRGFRAWVDAPRHIGPEYGKPLDGSEIVALRMAAAGVDVLNHQLARAMCSIKRKRPELINLTDPLDALSVERARIVAGHTFIFFGARATPEGHVYLANLNAPKE